MSNPDVWMPIYIGDYMADTAHLGALEHGAYLMLMFHYWRHHSLPQDDAKLSRIAKCTAREWASIKDTILSFFGPDLSHKRIDRELEEAASNSQKAKERAEKAAAARWHKHSSSNATSIPQAVLDECPSPSPSPVKKKNMPIGMEVFWAIYPRKEAKGRAEKALRAALKLTTIETILAGLKRYQWSDDKKFWPLAATWLNDRRWEDAAPQPNVTQMDPDARQKARLDSIASCIAKGFTNNLSATDGDLAVLVRDGRITEDQARLAGWSGPRRVA